MKECKKGSASRIEEADFALHQTIVKLAAHKRLLIRYSLLEQQIRVCIHSSDALIPDPSVIIGQHKPIVDAILARSVTSSGKLAEEHNLSEGDILAAHFAKLKKKAEGGRRSVPASSRKRRAPSD